MAHKWEPHYYHDGRDMGDPRRICLNCGIIQWHEGQGYWMRIGRRLWRPLAGKCKGKKKK